MPNHKTHDLIGAGTVVMTVPALVAVGYDTMPVALYAVGVVIGTYFLSPDLDIRSKIWRRWGCLRWYWYLYQRLIPHRSFLSHSGISVFIRVLYVALPFLLLEQFRAFVVYCYATHHNECVAFLCGLFVSDIIHVIADKLSTALKRRI